MISFESVDFMSSVPLTLTDEPVVMFQIPEKSSLVPFAVVMIVTYGKEASKIAKNKSITRASQAVTMANHLRLLEHEELWIAFLNGANRLISMEKITEGDTGQCLSSTKLIISKALSKNASALIMFHNHPSGTAKPSESDFKATTNIRKACGIMEILLLDHIVISMDQYYSMTEEMTHFFED